MSQPRSDAPSLLENRAAVVFGIGVAVLALTWLAGFSLRLRLWSADTVTLGRVPALSAAESFGGGISNMVNTVLILGLISAGYLAALWALRRGFPHAFPCAVGATAIACLALLPMRPVASPDVTHLAADVRTLVLHHRYPTSRANAPGRVDDPVAQSVIIYRNNPSGYGPVAYGIGGLALPFVGDAVRANIAGQKAVAGLFLVLMAVATGIAARRLNLDPGLAAGSVGLNPLLLFEFAGDGHNDSIMVAFGLFALPFLLEPAWRRRGVGAGLAAASVLSKFSLAVAAPVIAAVWFPRFRTALAIAIALAGIAATIVIMTGHGPRFATLGPATAVSLTTPANVLSQWLGLGRDGRDVVVGLGYSSWVIILGWIVYRHRLAAPGDIVAAIGLALWLFVFLSAGTLPWYQSWYLPFAFLSGRRWLTVVALVFSLGGFGPIVALHWHNDLATLLNISADNVVNLVVLMLWGVSGGAGAWIWWSDTHGRGTRPSVPSRQATRAQRRRQSRGAA